MGIFIFLFHGVHAISIYLTEVRIQIVREVHDHFSIPSLLNVVFQLERGPRYVEETELSGVYLI